MIKISFYLSKPTFLWLTHTGFLLDDLQYPLGGQQEVDEAAEAVSPVLPLHHAEELPQDGSSGDTEGSVQSRQGALDTAVQRLCVLKQEKIIEQIRHVLNTSHVYQ